MLKKTSPIWSSASQPPHAGPGRSAQAAAVSAAWSRAVPTSSARRMRSDRNQKAANPLTRGTRKTAKIMSLSPSAKSTGRRRCGRTRG